MLFCMCKMKTAATFILIQDGSCGAFIFSRLSMSNAKCGLYIHRRRKHAGCPEGKSPWLWVPIGASSIPVGARLSIMKA